jgi:hypothetical protein
MLGSFLPPAPTQLKLLKWNQIVILVLISSELEEGSKTLNITFELLRLLVKFIIPRMVFLKIRHAAVSPG